MNLIWTALKLFITMFILTGVIYPLLITLVAQITMPKQANGSLIVVNGKAVGSELIAQNFKDQAYFWPRPSAVEYDPIHPSGGSNLGPTSLKLKELITERAKKFSTDSNIIPSELVYASGSGLDPHISKEAAYFQLSRIAKARSIDKEKLKNLVDFFVEDHGIKYVNVLLINLELDKQFAVKKS